MDVRWMRKIVLQISLGCFFQRRKSDLREIVSAGKFDADIVEVALSW